MSEVTYSGEWIIYIATDKFPKYMDLAFDKLNSAESGLTYKPIALLAKQLVNGWNYTVLAERSSVWEPLVKRNVLITLHAKLEAKEPKDIQIISITLLERGQYMVTIPNGQMIDTSRIIPVVGDVLENLGEWEIDVKTSNWPAEVDKAIDLLNKQLGAIYKPFAYLGKQLVNGHNYAILAEVNVVRLFPCVAVALVIFNVNNGNIHIVSTENIIEKDGLFIKPGSILIDPTSDIPDEIMKEFNSVMEPNKVLGDVKPFAYLGEQSESGIDRYLAAEVTSAPLGAKSGVFMVIINAKEKTVMFKDILK